MHVMRMLSANGDTVIHEWDETTTEDRLAEIEAEFDALVKRGYAPFLIEEGLQKKINRFDPEAREILFLAPVIGG